MSERETLVNLLIRLKNQIPPECMINDPEVDELHQETQRFIDVLSEQTRTSQVSYSLVTPAVDTSAPRVVIENALTAQQEPVAWMWPHTPDADCPLKPGSWRTAMCFGIEKPQGRCDAIPLYTAPPSGVREGIDADAAVDSIIKDLRNRRGLRQEWDGIDEEIQQEIRQAWKEAITRAAEQVNAEPKLYDSLTEAFKRHDATKPPPQPADGVVVPRETLQNWRRYGNVSEIWFEIDALLAAAKEPRK